MGFSLIPPVSRPAGVQFMAQVSLENVKKVYPGGVEAVHDLTLGIRDQEFIILVGPSGCGKSTTLRMVAGLEEITDGVIRIGDQVVNDVPPQNRDIAMVFQSYALYPHMTVYKNMAFGLKLRKMPKEEIDQKVREAARLLGIENLLDRKPKALSGGQRQRVAVGRAIVRTPKAFLFDEPLSNLDAKLRVEMRAELKKLHRRLSTTTIYVTHDQEEAMTLGDRVVVMKDGIVHQCASPLELYERPVDRFVAGFMGTPPMNFLQGRILAENDYLYFHEGANRIRVPDHLHEAVGPWAGQEMIMGIRPESLSPRNEGRYAGEENTLNLTINVIETLGREMDLYVETAEGTNMTCRVEADRSLSDGQQLPMHIDMDAVHFFEAKKDGANVGLQAKAGETA
jgi:multiple sugar transport system ATP-binding protein